MEQLITRQIFLEGMARRVETWKQVMNCPKSVRAEIPTVKGHQPDSFKTFFVTAMQKKTGNSRT